METRSQKRKREIEENSKRSNPIIKWNKENIDIKKHHIPQQKISKSNLTIVLERVQLTDCEKEHHHAYKISHKSERQSEKNQTMTIGSSSMQYCHINNVFGSGELKSNGSDELENRAEICCIERKREVTVTKFVKKKKTPENKSEANKLTQKPTIQNSFQQCITFHHNDQSDGESAKSHAEIPTNKRKREIPSSPVRKSNRIRKRASAAQKPRSVERQIVNVGPKINRLKLEEKIKLEEPVNHFFEDEVVLATIPGYAPWPARILGINTETILVEFFGTGQINPVRSGALNRFDVKKIIPLLQRRGYRKAVRELELVLGIPHDVSII